MNCRKIIVPLCVFLLMSGTGIFSQKYNVPDTASLNEYMVQILTTSAAMMAMCLEKTRNLDLIKDWVLNLSDPYDHNNGARNGQPETEADYSGMAVIDRQYVRDKISVPHTWHASEVFLYLIDL